ncbi:signal transduction histidine kinase [Kibdelosporangium banguiense]|uniref:histidine kinase n=1 Tax=Kibdelosporangium banguiense TaxID=1365924 RepID=A0ABS4TVF0_9PSEU|nr:histidine kinase [Kibdelosporangium banguiense]MBP2328390.1 signal transduction histidine kinase [Kibdelosporangium banguiense]
MNERAGGGLRWAVDSALFGLAVLDAWLGFEPDWPFSTASVCVAVLALLLRRRYPYVTLALTLPTLAFSYAVVAVLIALYDVARHTRDRRVLALCSAVVAIGYAVPWPGKDDMVSAPSILVNVVYALMFGGAPAFLGQLVQARGDLSLQLKEINEARDHERELVAQTVLAKERAQLAREMHDVVSHQVSLIAVQAGVLQVSPPGPETKDIAATIRQLSVTTLDELRHMVTLLRVSGSVVTDLAPQPTLAVLPTLVANSGIEVTIEGLLHDDADAATQRAVYRTVQEALTNARKHAPGASATVQLWHNHSELGVTVTNASPTRPTLSLPSAQHGLIGLRERADLLNGTLTFGPTPDGGFRVHLCLPWHPAHFDSP